MKYIFVIIITCQHVQPMRSLVAVLKSNHSCSSFCVCSWWSPSWSKGPTIITSFRNCITAQYCRAEISVGTNLLWRIGGFESNQPIFCPPRLHSVMSLLLHNHAIHLVIHTDIIVQQKQCYSIRILYPTAAAFWLSNVAINCKALHRYLCATTLHGHNAMTKL